MNYELIPITIPADAAALERIERGLEKIHADGGQLVAFLPTTSATTVLGVFRSVERGALESHKTSLGRM